MGALVVLHNREVVHKDTVVEHRRLVGVHNREAVHIQRAVCHRDKRTVVLVVETAERVVQVPMVQMVKMVKMVQAELVGTCYQVHRALMAFQGADLAVQVLDFQDFH